MSYSFAAGYKSEALNDGSFAFGNYSVANSLFSFALGNHVIANGNHNWIIGSGYGDASGYKMFENPISNSLMMGFNMSETPSFYVEPFEMDGSRGRVGIHTIAPRSTFDVVGTLTTDGFVMPTADWVPGHVLTASGETGEAVWALPAASSGGGTERDFWQINGQNLFFDKVDPSALEYGNIGIGPNSQVPLARLHVFGDFRVEGFVRGNGTSGALTVHTDLGDIELGKTIHNVNKFTTTDSRIVFDNMIEVKDELDFNHLSDGKISFGSGLTQRSFSIVSEYDNGISKGTLNGIIIDADGNLGVGTDTPLAMLDVAGKIIASGDIETESNLQVEGNIIANGRIATANFQMTNQTAGADKILQSDVDGNASWVTAAESGVRLWDENASGNIFRDGSFVGIGTNLPEAPLHIDFGTGHAGIKFTTSEETYTNDYPIQFITGVNGNHGTLTQYIPNKGGDYIWTCQPDGGDIKVEGMRLAVSPWGNNQGVLSINGRLNTNSLKIISTENVNGYILQADADGDATWAEQWKKESTGVLSYQQPIAIGTTEVGIHHLVVAGSINAQEILVTQTVPGSDYVFESDYNLMPLNELETYVNTNKHLPEVMSAQEFKENGYSLGKMDDVLLRKVEELTLYMIAQQKIIDGLVEKVRSLEEE